MTAVTRFVSDILWWCTTYQWGSISWLGGRTIHLLFDILWIHCRWHHQESLEWQWKLCDMYSAHCYWTWPTLRLLPCLHEWFRAPSSLGSHNSTFSCTTWHSCGSLVTIMTGNYSALFHAHTRKCSHSKLFKNESLTLYV